MSSSSLFDVVSCCILEIFGGNGGLDGLSSSRSICTRESEVESLSLAKGSGVSGSLTLSSVGFVIICNCWFPVAVMGWFVWPVVGTGRDPYDDIVLCFGLTALPVGGGLVVEICRADVLLSSRPDERDALSMARGLVPLVRP